MLSLRLWRGSLASERPFFRESRVDKARRFMGETACTQSLVLQDPNFAKSSHVTTLESGSSSKPSTLPYGGPRSYSVPADAEELAAEDVALFFLAILARLRRREEVPRVSESGATHWRGWSELCRPAVPVAPRSQPSCALRQRGGCELRTNPIFELNLQNPSKLLAMRGQDPKTRFEACEGAGGSKSTKPAVLRILGVS